MRKDSLIIFATSIVLTLGIVGGIHYLYLQNQKLIPDEPAVKPQTVAGAVQSRPHSNQPAKSRTAKVIQCTQSDGSVFYTNAGRCEDADLDNTLSIYDHVAPAPRAKTTSKTKSSSQKSDSNKQSLKPIPRSMTNACSFPIGMARRIETKSLSLIDPPEESLWKSDYCRWICEARVENCGDLKDYLRYPNICPWEWRASKRSCGT